MVGWLIGWLVPEAGLVELVPWNLPVNVDHWPPNRAKVGRAKG